LLQLGAKTRRNELYERARSGDAAAANDLVWHLAVVGPVKELPRLPGKIHELLRPRAQLLVRLIELERDGGHPSELEQMLARATPFPLGEVLLAEASLVRVVQHGPREGSFFEQFVPALHRLARAEPEQDADPLAAAVAFHRRGQIRLLLPRVLGRSKIAAADLERALEVVVGSPGRIATAARARLEGNARLSLGRLHAESGRRELALELLERARAIDPEGPIGQAALEEIRRL
jgi:tetratricopeptide (TPR) repeat protein